MNKSDVPLVVDLDECLIKTDLLLESFYTMLKNSPLLILCVPAWLFLGKAYFKNELAKRVNIKAESLPYHLDLLAYLRNEHSQGKKLILATASVRKFAVNVAEYLGLFSEVLASDKGLNFSGKKKRELLLEKFGEKGFDYAGNSSQDLYIFPYARYAILVNPSPGILKAAQKTSNVKQVFDGSSNKLFSYFKSIRVHQWLKNLLLFIPIITSHKWNSGPAVTSAIVGFISLSFCASAGYLFNDFLDLDSDRNHPTKKFRPLASGNISPWGNSILMIALLVLGLNIAILLSWKFFVVLVIYCLISLSYTLYLKTYVLIDVLVLAALYTLRIMAGSVLADAPLSFWLLAFSIFIFFSLALVKRYSELLILSKINSESAPGRDYNVSDMGYLREMGIASGYLAILIVAFYINSSDVGILYSRPKVLWMICPVILYWISRIWLKAGRGEMTDDPIVFSLKDRGSRFVGLALIIIILLAI
jgi:4-hydroxybenzoate polyprenyltransferase